jgi:hypothetical protein
MSLLLTMVRQQHDYASEARNQIYPKYNEIRFYVKFGIVDVWSRNIRVKRCNLYCYEKQAAIIYIDKLSECLGRLGTHTGNFFIHVSLLTAIYLAFQALYFAAMAECQLERSLYSPYAL